MCVDDIDCWIEPDCGANASIMDEYQFRALSRRSPTVKKLKKSKHTLKTLQVQLEVREFKTTVRTKTRGD